MTQTPATAETQPSNSLPPRGEIPATEGTSRRDFLNQAALGTTFVGVLGTTGLASLAAGLAGGCVEEPAERRAMLNQVSMGAGGVGDLEIMQGALALEHEGIAAYQAFLDHNPDVDAGVRELAATFQKHHVAHREAIHGIVKILGGVPVTAKATYDFGPLPGNLEDWLRLAARIENKAALAYASAVGKLGNRDLAEKAARILGAEAWHTAVLRGAIKEDPAPDWQLVAN